MRDPLRKRRPLGLRGCPGGAVLLTITVLPALLAGCPLAADWLTAVAGSSTNQPSFGRSCWDLNGNGIGDPDEDINGDGNFDEQDCVVGIGPRGPQGPEGPAGADGLHCWDLNGNGLADPEEDINGDGHFNALDCVGAAGLAGPRGPAGPQGPTGPQGAAGAQGPAGADGNPSLFGNGSGGAKTFAFSATLADTNLQYTDFLVETGVTLTVPSGAVIRCTGTFTNSGTIVVQTSARGGTCSATSPTVDMAYAPAHPGVAISSAASGEYGSNAATRAGGFGGFAIGSWAARYIVQPGANAGGGGGGALSAIGGSGGGSLTILAETAVFNYGTITANGAAGPARCGGGAGGMVILSSSGVVANVATINANGGNGGNNDANGGAGGGGGGGIVHLIAPTIVIGTVNVQGGSNGAVGVAVTADPRQGGGGGGACGGNGGTGGNVNAAGTAGAATAGSVGLSIQTYLDPIWLF